LQGVALLSLLRLLSACLQEGDTEAAEVVLLHAWAALDTNVHKQVGYLELHELCSRDWG
jgi:hypothetical protein